MSVHEKMQLRLEMDGDFMVLFVFGLVFMHFLDEFCRVCIKTHLATQFLFFFFYPTQSHIHTSQFQTLKPILHKRIKVKSKIETFNARLEGSRVEERI